MLSKAEFEQFKQTIGKRKIKTVKGCLKALSENFTVEAVPDTAVETTAPVSIATAKDVPAVPDTGSSKVFSSKLKDCVVQTKPGNDPRRPDASYEQKNNVKVRTEKDSILGDESRKK